MPKRFGLDLDGTLKSLSAATLGMLVAYAAGWFKAWDILSQNLNPNLVKGAEAATRTQEVASLANFVIAISGRGIIILIIALGISVVARSLFVQNRPILWLANGILALVLIYSAAIYIDGIYDGMMVAEKLTSG